MKSSKKHINLFFIILFICGCINHTQPTFTINNETHACIIPTTMHYASTIIADEKTITSNSISHEGMVWIEGGTFMMGAADDEGRLDEYPQHKVKLHGFWIDCTEVTNAQFKKFIDATGYITIAERKPDWNTIKKQLPEGTPKPPDSILVAGSLVFEMTNHPVALNNPSQWWHWVKGANWKHPKGPNSNIIGKENYPVTQVAYEDALAYCKWAKKRLPTEAEWEYAARGGLQQKKYAWGNEDVETGKPKANTWQGIFPATNTQWDGFITTAPVKSFAANGYGLFDMAGNVWEWCADWYNRNYYQEIANRISSNPTGATSSYDPDEPTIPKKIIRGGSFLCNASYCKGYRVSSRMKSSPDTGLENTGFRCVADN